MENSNKTLLFILALLGIMVASSCSSKKCIDVDVPYTESIPYQAKEQYSEVAEYNVQNSTYAKKFNCLREGFWGDCKEKEWYIQFDTSVENLESEPVEFTVIMKFNTYYEGDIELKKRIKIPGYATRTVIQKHDLRSEFENYKKPTYNIVAGKVQKEREVTKYEKITKYRTCNTCVEDCGGKYEEQTEYSWWGIAFTAFIGFSILGWILDVFGIN